MKKENMHYDECTMMKCYNALTPAAVKITSSDTQYMPESRLTKKYRWETMTNRITWLTLHVSTHKQRRTPREGRSEEKASRELKLVCRS